MQYTVVTCFSGSVQLVIEADSKEQACDKAYDLIDKMNNDTLVSELGLDVADQDCWVEKEA